MTQQTIERERIINDIENALQTRRATMLQYATAHPKSFRETLLVVLKKRGIKRVTTRVADGNLYVIIREQPYVERLEGLVRKLMMSVDNEKLYEEAMEVLHGVQQ